MKTRTILATLAAASLVLTLGACGGSSDTSDSSGSDGAAETTAAAEEAPASDYVVTIDGCTKGTDYEGNQCVVLSFTFTNNSDENTSMASTVDIQVYQDGVQQEMAIVDSLDTANYSNNVQPGSSIQVQVAYEAPSDSDIEVDCYDMWSLDETELASQTFSLA
jgi:hypothetical protein